MPFSHSTKCEESAHGQEQENGPMSWIIRHSLLIMHLSIDKYDGKESDELRWDMNTP